MITIKNAVNATDVERCSQALLTFRPMVDPKTLVARTVAMFREGFQLAYIPDETGRDAAAIIGFRSYDMFRTGRIIYIDDLFTFPEYRGKGYAAALLDHVEKLARETNVTAVHLDSGFALHPAHRLYLNKGFVLACHHFSKQVSE